VLKNLSFINNLSLYCALFSRPKGTSINRRVNCTFDLFTTIRTGRTHLYLAVKQRLFICRDHYCNKVNRKSRSLEDVRSRHLIDLSPDCNTFFRHLKRLLIRCISFTVIRLEWRIIRSIRLRDWWWDNSNQFG